MTRHRIESWVRELGQVRARRGVVTTLLGGIVATVAGDMTSARPHKKKRKRHQRHQEGISPPAPPAVATCADGLTNSDETDVDCGGSCPRCANGKACASRQDCLSAWCAGGICRECNAIGGTCGQSGTSVCQCVLTGSERRCVQPAGVATSCQGCPPGTVTCEMFVGPGAGAVCYTHCAST